jgi:hypothetical protein
MKKGLVILLLLTAANFVYGQNKKEIPINISYFGDYLLHPGIEIGYENTFYKGFNFTVSIGTYIHQRNHVGLFFNAGANWRHTFPIGYSVELGLGLGYMHKWEHGGDTYLVDDSGNVSVKPKYGQPRFMPFVKLGLLGWDFRKKTNLPLRINVDVIGFAEYPFNNFILPHFALKVGGTYYFTF